MNFFSVVSHLYDEIIAYATMPMNLIGKSNGSVSTANAPLKTDDIPLELWRLIAVFLDDPKDIVHLGLGNRHLRVLLSDALLWKSLLLKHFPIQANSTSEADSLSVYKQQVKVACNVKARNYCLQILRGHQKNVHQLIVNEGRLISSSEDCTIKVWDLKIGQVLKTLQGHNTGVDSVAVYKGNLISAAWKTFKIWDFKTGQEIKTLIHGEDSVDHIIVWNDNLISVGAIASVIQIWDINTGEKLKTLEGHRQRIVSIAVCNDWLVSGSHDSDVKIWDLKTRQEIRTLSEDEWIECAEIYDGKVISSTSDGRIQIWDLETGQKLAVFNSSTGVSIECFAICAGMLVCGMSDGAIQIRDFITGEELQTLRGQQYSISSLVVVDGKIISSSYDGNLIQIWDFIPK